MRRLSLVMSCVFLVGVLLTANAFALTVNTNDIANGAVTTSKIADGAVTDAKIQGKISASKLESAANIIVVAKSGGDYTSITEAMNAISPSESNPYVIKIAPGTYTDAANGGSEVFPITMKAFVSLIGSGADNTKIYSPQTHAIAGDSAGVLIEGLTSESSYGSGAFLRSVTGKRTTLRNAVFSGHNSYSAYIGFEQSSDSVNVTNCEFHGTEGLGVYVQGGKVNIENSKFIQTGPLVADGALDIYPNSADVFISNSIFRGYAYSIWMNLVNASHTVIDNVDADKSIQTTNVSGGSVLIKNSQLRAIPGNISVYTDTPEATKVATSMIEGTITPGVKLFQCFDQNLNPITTP